MPTNIWWSCKTCKETTWFGNDSKCERCGKSSVFVEPGNDPELIAKYCEV